MVHLKNPINLAHFLNGQIHRIPPEQLEQTVNDYYMLADIVHACFNGKVDFKTMDQLINNVQEKVFLVKEYTRSDGFNKETYKHDEQTLDVLKPQIIKASKKLFASIFPEANISNWHDVKFGTFNEKFKKLNPLIIKTYLLVQESESNKSYEELLNDIEAKYNKASRNISDERINKFVSMGGQAAILYFFANKRHLPFVQVNNPYSLEKSSEEAAKQHYELAKITMSILISDIEELYQQPNLNPDSIIEKLNDILSYTTNKHEDYQKAFIENGLFKILDRIINSKKVPDKNDRRIINQLLNKIEQNTCMNRKNKANKIKSKLSEMANRGRKNLGSVFRIIRNPNREINK